MKYYWITGLSSCLAIMTAALPYSLTIEGEAGSAPDGLPLAGVRVMTPDGQAATFTHRQGRYALTMADHHASLIVSQWGFATRQVSIEASSMMYIARAPMVQPLASQYIELSPVDR